MFIPKASDEIAPRSGPPGMGVLFPEIRVDRPFLDTGPRQAGQLSRWTSPQSPECAGHGDIRMSPWRMARAVGRLPTGFARSKLPSVERVTSGVVGSGVLFEPAFTIIRPMTFNLSINNS